MVALPQLRAGSKPNDEIFVLHFNEQLTYGLPSSTRFTDDRNLLDAALDKNERSRQNCPLRCMYEGLKNLAHSSLSKKALLVISDGGDNLSVHKASDVVRGPIFPALFFALGITIPWTVMRTGCARKLAQSTGGEAYFPKDCRRTRFSRDDRERSEKPVCALLAPSQNASGPQYHAFQVKG